MALRSKFGGKRIHHAENDGYSFCPSPGVPGEGTGMMASRVKLAGERIRHAKHDGYEALMDTGLMAT